jgi:hypothetical protein
MMIYVVYNGLSETATGIANDLRGLRIARVFCSSQTKGYARAIANEIGVKKCASVRDLEVRASDTMNKIVSRTFAVLFRWLWKYEHKDTPLLLITQTSVLLMAVH